MKKFTLSLAVLGCLAISANTFAQDNGEENPADIYSALEFRSIGPAVTSGRVTDFAVTPGNPYRFFVATASGGVWKTENDGVTWEPVFDSYGSFSIGDVEMDPKNHNVIWVGTGENNSQRSVAYGDGVYKSIDGGASFEKVGLDNSEHIGDIIIDPRDSNTVFVAAQGPLWSDGGDRGLYKTTDGGATWRAVLEVDEHTGANDVVQNSDNPDLLLATTYQRRRHVWGLVHGGPGAGIHRSEDGGETWTKVTAGMPGGDLGRIGLATAPSSPNTVYAIIEADEDSQGIYRSDDFGVTWSKQSSRMTTSGTYYNELFVDPHNPNRLYLMDTFISVSEDGGVTWNGLSVAAKHVDEHALWIDPDNTDHLITGNDGGVYESYDRGATWRHMKNLPITQFYRVEVDNAEPFYYVWGGTQDNQSLGAPSQTTAINGIENNDWVYTLYGDGFQTRVDPENPDIIYSQLQYGLLFRYDKKNGNRVWITPQPDKDEDTYRWNWNSALIISPHDNERLYYGAEYLFRSDDMGNSWVKVSHDLSRDLDRNRLEMMGRVWSVDAIAKNDSTSIYGSIISLSESRFQEGLIYVGTDDGLIQITEDGGQNWVRVERVRGVPDMSYVGDLHASKHDVNVVYATFDNHKKGDFAPYVYKSTDKGRTWTSISGNLPERGTVHAIQEDHVDPNLLFAGTEFGVFFSQDGGGTWTQFKGSVPTIAVRDLEIQERESDLVLATFGRGFYILDNYTPLRIPAEVVKEADAYMFDVKDALLFAQDDRWLSSFGGAFGDDFYSAENPPFGATFTYYLKDGLKTKKGARREAEKEVEEEGGDTFYPSWEELREEDWEEAPIVLLTIRDNTGNVVRRLTGPASSGLHRISWDLLGFSFSPLNQGNSDGISDGGFYVAPGDYTVTLGQRLDGVWLELTDPISFSVNPLLLGTFDTDLVALSEFLDDYSELMRRVMGTVSFMDETRNRIDLTIAALKADPDADEEMNIGVRDLDLELRQLDVLVNGDATITSRNEQARASIIDRVQGTYGLMPFILSVSIEAPTQETVDSLAIAREEFEAVLVRLQAVDAGLTAIEDEMGDSAPWAPGRIPE